MYPVWYGMTSGKIANIMNHHLELHKNRYRLRLYSQLCTENSLNHDYNNTCIQNFGFLSFKMKIYNEFKFVPEEKRKQIWEGQNGPKLKKWLFHWSKKNLNLQDE